MRILLSIFCVGFAPAWAWAQTGPQDPPAAAEPAGQMGPQLEAEITSTTQMWLRELGQKPTFVLLGTAPDFSKAGDKLADILKERLLLLGRKRFSNGQWRTYWERQRELAGKLAQLYAQVGTGVAGERAAGLRDWATLAADKVENQEAYLKAIGTEQDALEARREAALDVEGEQSAGTVVPPAGDPNPYQAREARIAQLKARSDFQARRRLEAEQELELIQRQIESLALLRDAQVKDVELATRERAIAGEQAESSEPAWAAIWNPIAEGATIKVHTLESELLLNEQRRNNLEVEAELERAQIQYRKDTIRELELALEEASGLASLSTATWETIKSFASTKLWKVLLTLALIYAGVLLALRVVNLGRAAFLRAVQDDDPNAVSQTEKRAKTVSAVFTPVAKGAVYVMGGLLALENIGVDTAPLLGSVAILGLAISFGSQNLVRDLVNGFFILVENQFDVGDVVEINGKGGVIESVNVRSTRMRGLNGTLYIIPNGEITNVANLTRQWSRAVLHIRVAYGSSMKQVRGIIAEVGEGLARDPAFKEMLMETPAYVGITSLDETAVVFRVTAKTQPGMQWSVERELNLRIYDALNAAGVEIPLPQRVVRLKSDVEAAPASSPVLESVGE